MYAILGDIGGTNTRLALAKCANSTPFNIQHFKNADFKNLKNIITHYLSLNNLSQRGAVKNAALAVAAPITGDLVTLTNVNFSLSKTHYIEHFGFERLNIINDFTALAYCLPHMQPQDLLKVGGGKVTPNANKLVIGPGTGLGLAALIPCDLDNTHMHWHAIASEAGHSTFSPNTEREFDLVKKLRKNHYRISIERLISGIGIKTIYDTLADIDTTQVKNLTPSQISTRALDNQDPRAVESLNLFCNILGRVAGDHCLHFSAFGGVYIAGGIIPKILPFFLNSNFRQTFEDKGRMASLTQGVATQIITHKTPALVGALASLD